MTLLLPLMTSGRLHRDRRPCNGVQDCSCITKRERKKAGCVLPPLARPLSSERRDQQTGHVTGEDTDVYASCQREKVRAGPLPRQQRDRQRRSLKTTHLLSGRAVFPMTTPCADSEDICVHQSVHTREEKRRDRKAQAARREFRGEQVGNTHYAMR